MRRSRSPQDVRSRRRQVLTYALWIGAFVLCVNALVGDRGYFSGMRASREYAATVEALDRMNAENALLREKADRLKTDPAALEEAARRDLNLIRPGETLVIIKDAIKDAKPAPTPPAQAPRAERR